MKRLFAFGVMIAALLVCSWAALWLMPKTIGPPTQPRNPPGESQDVAFEDVTERTGIRFTYRNGDEANLATILESLGGGVAAFDYDGDGLPDLYFPGGGNLDGRVIRGLPGKLFKNLGDWKFQDVTEQAGLAAGPLFYTHGVAVADYDRDGFPDLLVTGWGQVVLWHNEADPNGSRRFVDVTAQAGLSDIRWSTSAGWADLDGDGFPDLYLCQYVDWSFDNDPECLSSGRRDVCAPQKFQPIPDRLFRNRGDGTFQDVSKDSNIRPDGKGLGVILADLDGDGRPDIYVGNDATENFLYRNQGGFRLEEAGTLAGVASDDNGLYNGSMGVDAADFDGSGRPSLFVTNFQGEIHGLYRNLDGQRFRHYSQAAGLGRFGRSFVGFGTAFLDVDRDSWEDLLIANGHVLRYPAGATYRQRPLYLRNEDHEGRRQFRSAAQRAGTYFNTDQVGRGLAVADFDQDGWPDLVISHQNDPVVLLRNVAGERNANKYHWLRLNLVGKQHRDLVGTVLTLELEGRKLIRYVKGGGSYLSASEPTIDFGLGSATKFDKLTVRWSHGKAQEFSDLAVDQVHTLQEN